MSYSPKDSTYYDGAERTKKYKSNKPFLETVGQFSEVEKIEKESKSKTKTVIGFL